MLARMIPIGIPGRERIQAPNLSLAPFFSSCRQDT
jgi:hypothetical protein